MSAGGANGRNDLPGHIASAVRSSYWKSLYVSTCSGANGPYVQE